MANAFRGLVEVMKRFTFGVELETVGARRDVIAKAIHAVTGGSIAFGSRCTVTMPDGRSWRIESDGSLCIQDGSCVGRQHSAHCFQAEVVTPILGWSDMDLLQKIVRTIRGVRARVNVSCGLHVHVGVADLDGAALGRLAKLCYQQEDLLYKALRVSAGRTRYCAEASPEFIKRVVEHRPATKEALLVAWYGTPDEMQRARWQHYHGSRYRGLNLHAVQFHGTAEFRYFDGTLHAGQVKTYVQLCLALVAKAYTGKQAIARKRAFNDASAKYDVRNFLLRLGMIGKEFETARHHLLHHLNGKANRQKPAPAVKKAVAAPAEDTAAVAAAPLAGVA